MATEGEEEVDFPNDCDNSCNPPKTQYNNKKHGTILLFMTIHYDNSTDNTAAFSSTSIRF